MILRKILRPEFFQVLSLKIWQENIKKAQLFADYFFVQVKSPQNNARPTKLLANRYELVRMLARGSMGTVYLAIDRMLGNTQVALKVLHPKFLSDDIVYKRFSNEVVVARKLSHRNIVRIHDFDEAKTGERMISMEYVEGPTLDAVLADLHGTVDPDDDPCCRLYEADFKRLLGIYRKLLEGVAYAHENGILHRDLKPSNILINADDEPKVADFGLAAITGVSSGLTTDQNVLLGTPEYMAPEHVIGQRMTSRSDIYSLGIIAFELLTGRTPFHAETPVAVAYMQVKNSLPSLADMPEFVPQSFLTLIKRATLKDPKERFSSVDEMISFLDSKSIPGDITTSLYKTAVIKKRNATRKHAFGSRPKAFSRRFPFIYYSLKWTVALTFGAFCFLATTVFMNRYHLQLNQVEEIQSETPVDQAAQPSISIKSSAKKLRKKSS